MVYTETITRRELERIMRQIPNFPPRGHGVMILCKHEYSAKDCDCRSCLHHTGRGRNIRCGLEKCSCLEERIKAGAASYKETLYETMSFVSDKSFMNRLNQYLKESEEFPMDYRNEKHRIAFTEAVEKLNRRNFALMAAVYLLTADHQLWKVSKRQMDRNGIKLREIRLENSTEYAYTLFCAAKDLALGTKHLTISDLADTDLIPPRIFALICNAMAIRRFGLGAIHFENKSQRGV